MVTGEKFNEFRKNSDWIYYRLYTKKGLARTYDFIKFVNGYGGHRPYFIVRWNGFKKATKSDLPTKIYSNGLTVKIDIGDFIIHCGEIIETGNL